LDDIQNKVIQLANDPAKAAKEAGDALEELAKDPQAFAKKMMQAMEDKAVSIMKQNVKAQFN
jgi:hypothetical protein